MAISRGRNLFVALSILLTRIENPNGLSSVGQTSFVATTATTNVDNSYDNGTTESSSEYQRRLFQAASVICGILIVPIGFVGIVGNLLTIHVLTRPYMSSSINVLLTGMAVIDCLLLCVSTPSFGLLAFSEQSDAVKAVVNYFVTYGYPIACMAQTASVWCILLISLETYLSVCCPLRARLVKNPKRAKIAILSIAGTAIAYNFCRFFEYETLNNTLCPVLKRNPIYLKFYVHWLYFFLIFLIPLAALVIFNGLTVKEIKGRSRDIELTRQQNQQHEVAYTVVFVVLVFFTCNCLAFVLNAIEANQHQTCYIDEGCSLLVTSTSDTMSTSVTRAVTSSLSTASTNSTIGDNCIEQALFLFLVDLNNLLVCINSSVNFVIYLTFCKRFRKYFCQIFPCRCRLVGPNSRTGEIVIDNNNDENQRIEQQLLRNY